MAQRSAAMVAVRKKVNKFDYLLRERIKDNIENYHVPVIINLIMTEYDIELTGRVTNRRSRTNPLFYRDEFEEALRMYPFITEGATETTLSIPETNTFNWNQGRLRIIENIVEGTIGRFIEVDEEEYINMYAKRPVIQPFDRAVPIKERIYLLKYTGDIKRRWAQSFPKKQIVRYPFSNQPPINIFDSANQYAVENINKWIDEAVKDTTKEIAK